jgi:hypothetical protein
MKIGVPIKDGFTQLVTVKFDRSRNESSVTGFCIDAFDAVLSRLDYALPYDLIPYAEEGQNHTQSYNDLVQNVYRKVCSSMLRWIAISILVISMIQLLSLLISSFLGRNLMQ